MSQSFFAAIGMGSNLNDPLTNMNAAVGLLRKLPGCYHWTFSSLYHTEPIDCPVPLDYLNAVACCSTELAPQELLDRLLGLEDLFGRERPFFNAPRPLDLDLLLYEDQILEEPRLVLPHPRMLDRLFVLEPLCELCPQRRHPVAGLSLSQLRDRALQGPHGKAGVIKSPQPWAGALF